MSVERDLSGSTQEQKVLGEASLTTEQQLPGYLTIEEQLARNEITVREMNLEIKARRTKDTKLNLEEENENS